MLYELLTHMKKHK